MRGRAKPQHLVTNPLINNSTYHVDFNITLVPSSSTAAPTQNLSFCKLGKPNNKTHN